MCGKVGACQRWGVYSRLTKERPTTRMEVSLHESK